MLELIATGHLGGDATVKELENSKVVVFNVAVNESYLDRNGTRVEKTTWLSCSIFKRKDQSLEIVKYLKKGTRVLIKGNIGLSTWKKDDGSTGARFEVRVKELELIGTKENAKPETGTNGHTPASAAEPVPANVSNYQETEDDLPW